MTRRSMSPQLFGMDRYSRNKAFYLFIYLLFLFYLMKYFSNVDGDKTFRSVVHLDAMNTLQN
jgi:hypothetical protein